MHLHCTVLIRVPPPHPMITFPFTLAFILPFHSDAFEFHLQLCLRLFVAKAALQSSSVKHCFQICTLFRGIYSLYIWLVAAQSLCYIVRKKKKKKRKVIIKKLHTKKENQSYVHLFLQGIKHSQPSFPINSLRLLIMWPAFFSVVVFFVLFFLLLLASWRSSPTFWDNSRRLTQTL